jgi:hypothetical protein
MATLDVTIKDTETRDSTYQVVTMDPPRVYIVHHASTNMQGRPTKPQPPNPSLSLSPCETCAVTLVHCQVKATTQVPKSKSTYEYGTNLGLLHVQYIGHVRSLLNSIQLTSTSVLLNQWEYTVHHTCSPTHGLEAMESSLTRGPPVPFHGFHRVPFTPIG